MLVRTLENGQNRVAELEEWVEYLGRVLVTAHTHRSLMFLACRWSEPAEKDPRTEPRTFWLYCQSRDSHHQRDKEG